ncbi:G2/M phase-specific E3 ubiquitin-protein ligase-like, partial [Acipenser oxyrinchus oxyrinchus]
VEDILQSLRVGINEEEVIRFNLNRRNVWDGVVRATMCNPTNNNENAGKAKLFNQQKCKRSSEFRRAIRDCFRLVLQHITNSPMFDGPENQHTYVLKNKALNNNSYFYAGQLIAMSIVHRGPSPHFFAPVLFQAVALGPDNVHAAIEDITDPDIKCQLSEVGVEHM